MYKLIICVVPKDNGEVITSAANNAGSGGGTILLGKGLSDNSVLQLLGLGDTSKDITYNIIDDSIFSNVKNSIIEATKDKKTNFGFLFSIDLIDFIKSGNNISSKTENSQKTDLSTGDDNMENSYELINVIVNKGYAEDAMDAARKAGAGGGTIIGARGTAREDDAKFFGMKIVPEKDMLMILVPTDKKQPIIDAIKNLPCLSEAGSGIVFCSPANDFTVLGKKN